MSCVSVVTSVNATLAQTAAKHVLPPLRVPRTVPRERHLRLRISRTAYATRTRPEPYFIGRCIESSNSLCEVSTYLSVVEAVDSRKLLESTNW